MKCKQTQAPGIFLLFEIHSLNGWSSVLKTAFASNLGCPTLFFYLRKFLLSLILKTQKKRHGETLSSKGARISFGGHRFLFLVAKGAVLGISHLNLVLQKVLSKITEAEVKAEIADLIALPTSTLVSSKHRPQTMNYPYPTASQLLDHSERQIMQSTLDMLDIQATESCNSWELLEHRISAAHEILNHHLVLQATTHFGYECLEMIHPEFLSGNRSTLEISVDFKKINRDVTILHSAGQIQGILNDDHILYICPTNGGDPKYYVSYTSFLKVLKSLRLLVFCQRSLKRKAPAEDSSNSASETSSDSSLQEDSLTVVNVVPVIRDDSDLIPEFASDCLRGNLPDFDQFLVFASDLPVSCTVLSLSCRTLSQDF